MGENSDAIQRTVKILRGSGLIPEGGDAVVQICLSLAAAVDSEPGNASLWREYRQAVEALRSLESAGGSDIDDLIAAIRDPQDRPSDARSAVGADS